MPSTDDIPADQHHPASSSAAACLPAPVVAADHVSAPTASSALHSLLSPWAIGVVVLLALVVLVSAWSTTTTSFGPNHRLLVVEPHSPTAGSQYAPASAAPQTPSPGASGRFSNGRQDQPQQQINALRAQMDQLQYQLVQLQQYAPAGGGDWMEPVWPFFNVEYHPKSMLVRRHMAWQPMRRGIENDERSMTQRHIAWQPMKRQQQPEHGMGEQYDGVGPDVAATVYAAGDGQKQQVMRTVEQELIEVLRAGERLGVSADEILAHLRARNSNNNAGGGLGGRRRR